MIILTDSTYVLNFAITALDYKMTVMKGSLVFYFLSSMRKKKLFGFHEIIPYYNMQRKAV